VEPTAFKRTIVIVTVSIVLILNAKAVWAQEFEAASIKPNRSGEGRSSMRGSQGRIVMENVSLQKVILWAYGIADDRDNALNGPDWLPTEHFDIQATFATDANVDNVRRMTQNLLADRFKLALNSVTTERKVYALVIAKNGPKIHPVDDDGQRTTSSASGRLEAHKIAMTKLADLLTRILDRPVVDSTGLAGVFDFNLQWSPDETQRIASVEDIGAEVGSVPSLFSALQEQLGLKLESRNQPTKVLVVDHVERVPTSN
jgi:uncharacterized protein (TIGR03435 family)